MNEIIIILVATCVLIALIIFHSLDRKSWNKERSKILEEWKAEREALYDRIHSGSFSEYKHAEFMKIKAEKPKETTTLEEV